MAYSFPPAPDRPDDPAGDAQYTQQRASRFTPRSPLRSVLPRIIVLAVTLVLLVGVFALVHANTSTRTPVRSVSSSTGAQTTGASTASRASSAPDFTLATLGGGSFRLASQQGHVVLFGTTVYTQVQGKRRRESSFTAARHEPETGEE